MRRYLLTRVVMVLPTLVGASVLIFLMLRLLPGGPVDVLTSPEIALPPEARQALEAQFGLDVPIPVQYVRWLGGILRGDLGRSIRTNQPVLQVIGGRLPISLELAGLSILLCVAAALPLGIISAVRRNSAFDLGARVLGLLGLSIPNFWLAILLLLVAARYFNWFPPMTFVSLLEDPRANLAQMVLPAVTLATSLMAVVMRMTRSSMLEVLGQELVRTARDKGLGERLVVAHHALRNALIPVVTVIGIQAGYLLGGVVITEQVFGIAGMGSLLINGVGHRDYPVIQAAVLFSAVAFVGINLAVDMLYGYLDPRIRYG
ncbi:MAG: ABC transporter permease [Armatimonadetes bacterium]|nr:ABC transporter permease [Armatimonadota bacterium]